MEGVANHKAPGARKNEQEGKRDKEKGKDHKEAGARILEVQYKYEAEEQDLLAEAALTTINFHKEFQRWGWLSNFYEAKIRVDGTGWRTSEHYFQACKFQDAKSKEEVRGAETPQEAAARGRDRDRKLRGDWEEVKEGAMLIALKAKFRQHEYLGMYLRHTYPLALNEAAPWDTYWGSGRDGQGKNRLGALLHLVREELLEEEHVKEIKKGPGQVRDQTARWTESGHWSHLPCEAGKCPCCRAEVNRTHAGAGRVYVIHVCTVCGPRTDVQVGGGDPALNEKGRAGGQGRHGRSGGDSGAPDGEDPGREEKGENGTAPAFRAPAPHGGGTARSEGGTELVAGGEPVPDMGPRASSAGKGGVEQKGGSQGGVSSAEKSVRFAMPRRPVRAEEMRPRPAWDVTAEELGVIASEAEAEGGLADEHPALEGWTSDRAFDPGKPRKGDAWCDLPRSIQERVEEEIENNAAVILCEHRLRIGGACGGRLIVPEATLQGLQDRTCCSASQPMSRAARARVDPPGARHPDTVLDIEQMRKDIEETNARGGLQFNDWGVFDSLQYGIAVGFVGERQGVVVFPVSASTTREPGAGLVKDAVKKDLLGLPDVQGRLVPNIVPIGRSPEEAMDTLWDRFPQLRRDKKWLLAFAVGAVPASLGRKARLVDDMSRGPEPASCNNNTPASATPLLRLGGGRHFKAEILKLMKERPGVALRFAKADYSSWFRQSKAQGLSAPLNVFTDPDTGMLMLREGAGFGARTYPASTSRVTVCIAFYLIVWHGLRVQLYIDDVILICYVDEPLEEQWALLLGTFKRWNVKVSDPKCLFFEPVVDWLGVHYDVPRLLLRVTESRRGRMLLICNKANTDEFLTVKLLQSFYHSILSVLDMVQGSKACLHETARLLSLAGGLEKTNARQGITFRGVRSTGLFQLEVDFWKQLLELNGGAALQGSIIKKKALASDFLMIGATDASTTGVGGVFTDPLDPTSLEFFHHKFTTVELQWLGEVCSNKVEKEGGSAWTIGVLELWTLVIFVELFFQELCGRAGEPPHVWNLLNDNANTVAWVNGMWSRAPNGLVALLLRQLAFLEFAGNFRVVAQWVSTHENECADALSRQEHAWFQKLTLGLLHVSQRQVPGKYREMLSGNSNSCWSVGGTPIRKRQERWAKEHGSTTLSV